MNDRQLKIYREVLEEYDHARFVGDDGKARGVLMATAEELVTYPPRWQVVAGVGMMGFVLGFASAWAVMGF